MMRRKCRVKCGNEKGSSIVEVMAAFVILIIGLGFFTTACYTALSVTNDSIIMGRLRGEVLEKHYREPDAGTPFYEGGAKAISVKAPGSDKSFVLPGNMKELKLPADATAEQVFSIYFFTRQ